MNIVLILPERRLWRWHGQLIAELERLGTLQLRLAPSLPHPLAARAWLAIERRAFGERGGAVPVAARNLFGQAATPPRRAAADTAMIVADVVIDLADAAPPHSRRLRLRFDGEAGEAALFATLYGRRSPLVEVVDEAGRVLAVSYPAVEVRDELGRSLSYIQARLVALILRAVTQPPSPAVAPSSGEGGPPGTLTAFIAHAAAVKLGAKLSRGRSTEEDWRVALRPSRAAEGVPTPEGFSPVSPPPGVFHADPFLFARAGETFLFVEAYPWATRKGVIACARIGKDGRPGAFETVLEADHHLSYPQVFEHGGEVYMLPETASVRRLEFYRALDFPRRWERVGVMLEGLRIADATLLEHEGRWWLFASVASFGGATQDEVFAWHGPAPTGPWTAHALNPLVSDLRSGRPAGRFVRRGGRLYRPAQDGGGGYGSGLAWMAVEALTPTTYVERLVARWRGADFGPYTGVHTFNEGGGFEAVDFKSPRGQAP